MEPKIELAKPRDFGEIVGDTFTFIKQNFKSLLKQFFTFCGFFMIVSLSLSVLKNKVVVGATVSSPMVPANTYSNISQNLTSAVLLMVSAFLLYVMAVLTITSYVALYKHNGNNPPTTAEVWGYIKYYFPRTLLAVFITTILFAFGFILCLLPGFWLFPIFGLIFPIMIVENGSFHYAFNRAFTLIKDNWWSTAGAVLVLWIISYILMMVISLPATILGVASIFLGSQRGTAISLPVNIFVSTLQQLGQLINIIPIVGISLCYFNLAETKEGTSLLDRINKFGENQPPTDTQQGEY